VCVHPRVPHASVVHSNSRLKVEVLGVIFGGKFVSENEGNIVLRNGGTTGRNVPLGHVFTL